MSSPGRRRKESEAEYWAGMLVFLSLPGLMFARGWRLAGWILLGLESLAWLVLWAYGAQRPGTPWMFRTLWIVPIAIAVSVVAAFRLAP